MTDRLSIYNGALTVHLGEEPLEALNDNRAVRHALDDVWERDGVDTCLQRGQWNFATRSSRREKSPDVTPDFGFLYAFPKPEDFIRLTGFCSDDRFKHPIREYGDEAGYWFCDLETIYVRYVSNDDQYGGDFSLWPKDFTRWVESWFALQITKVSTYSDKKDDVEVAEEKLLSIAKSNDAMEQPSKQNPPGSWSTARSAGGGREYGSLDRLTN